MICSGRYELESGRESVLEMLNLTFSRFPPSVISVNCGLFFVTIAPRLINDDSVTCRKLAALTIQSLLEKVEDKDKDSLFSIVLLWLNDKTVSSIIMWTVPLQLCNHCLGYIVLLYSSFPACLAFSKSSISGHRLFRDILCVGSCL